MRFARRFFSRLATSLQGGQLIRTPLRGIDNVDYAVAQGDISASGFSFTASGGGQGVPFGRFASLLLTIAIGFTMMTFYDRPIPGQHMVMMLSAQGGGIGNFTALGLSIGATMACRVTMATLGLVAIIAVAPEKSP